MNPVNPGLLVGPDSPLSQFDPQTQAALATQICVRRTLFGDGNSTHTRRLTACHEAGHLVAFQLCGLRSREGKIWYDTDLNMWLGRSTHSVAFGPIEVNQHPRLAVALAFEWIAGSAAEALFGNVADPGSSLDEMVPAEALLEIAASAVGLPFEDLANVLRKSLWTFLDAFRASGEAIADDLEQRKSLNRKDLRRLLTDVPALGRDSIGRQIIEAAGDAELVASFRAELFDYAR